MTTTTDPPVTLPQPVIVTSNKVSPSPQVPKATPRGQDKRIIDKGQNVKPHERGKKMLLRQLLVLLLQLAPLLS